MVYIASSMSEMIIQLANNDNIASLLAKETTVLAKYSDYASVFLKKSAAVLSKRAKLHEHSIKLKDGKQLFYMSIYSPEPIKFKTFKTFIGTNLASGFIKASKLLVGILILFVPKSNNSFCLYINYQKLNNFIIKNSYLILLISEFLDQLS